MIEKPLFPNVNGLAEGKSSCQHIFLSFHKLRVTFTCAIVSMRWLWEQRVVGASALEMTEWIWSNWTLQSQGSSSMTWTKVMTTLMTFNRKTRSYRKSMVGPLISRSRERSISQSGFSTGKTRFMFPMHSSTLPQTQCSRDQQCRCRIMSQSEFSDISSTDLPRFKYRPTGETACVGGVNQVLVTTTRHLVIAAILCTSIT